MSDPIKRGLAPSHPGAHLADVLDGLKAQAGVTREAAARRMGIARRTLYKVIEGASGVTPAMAVRLEAFGLGSAEMWLNLQQAHDLAMARAALRAESLAIAPAWPVERADAA
jgi:addiction module HigA family antidote